MDTARLILEMIQEYEQMRNMIESRLCELRVVAKELGIDGISQPIDCRQNEIKTQIEQMRQQILSKLPQMSANKPFDSKAMWPDKSKGESNE